MIENMEKIRAIFLDFDWTLFDHKSKSFNLKGVEALNLAHHKGIKLIINSARSYYALKELKTFDLIPFDGYVVNNGGATIIDDKILYAYFIADDVKNEIIDYLNKHNYSYNLVTLYNTYIKETNKKIIDEFYTYFYEPYPLDIKEYKGEKVLSIQIFSSEESDPALKELTSKFNLLYNRFTSTNVELTSKEFLKSEGVKTIYNYLKLNKDEAMAFGDDTNDIPMFQMVKYGICLGNGKDEAKKYAYYVTDNIENDGLFNALKHFNIID